MTTIETRAGNGVFIARIYALVAVIFWGVSFVATKAALREMSPLALIVMRFALGLVLLYGLLLARGESMRISRIDLPALLLMGFLGVFLHQMLQAHALTLTSAVNTGWLIGITPLWSAILAAIFLKERFGGLKLAGLILGFAGAVMVIFNGTFDWSMVKLPSTTGDLLILVSTLNWAVFSIVVVGTIKRLGALRATASMMVPGWLMLLPFFLAKQSWREYDGLSAQTWAAILFLGIGCSGLGYLFWYGALERIDASKVASFLYIEPIVTFVAAVLLLGEPIRLLTILGGLMVIAGVVLVQKAKS